MGLLNGINTLQRNPPDAAVQALLGKCPLCLALRENVPKPVPTCSTHTIYHGPHPTAAVAKQQHRQQRQQYEIGKW